MAEIFVSYSHDDKVETENLVAVLQESYDVWYDPHIKGGEPWWIKIVDEIQQCKFFIFLISSEWLNSNWCKKELKEAENSGKILIPIRLKNSAKIPEDLNTLQIIDMTQGLNVQFLSKLYATIINNSRLYSLPIEERQRQADLRLLRNLWPLNNHWC